MKAFNLHVGVRRWCGKGGMHRRTGGDEEQTGGWASNGEA